MYMLLKHSHISFAALSILFFTLRGYWMLSTPDMLKRRWVRIAPHVIDTLLLVSAIALTITVNQYPLTHSWLTAKLIALIAYIILGTIALKRGKTRKTRTLAFALALACVVYIVWVALHHTPYPDIS